MTKTEPNEEGWLVDGRLLICPKCSRVREGTVTWGLEHQKLCDWRPISLLGQLAEDARALAGRLFGPESPPCREQAHGEIRCLEKLRRSDGKLFKKGDAKGSSLTPFPNYDHREMCGPCAAYWFAEMSAQTLESLATWERRHLAEEEREGLQRRAVEEETKRRI